MFTVLIITKHRVICNAQIEHEYLGHLVIEGYTLSSSFSNEMRN